MVDLKAADNADTAFVKPNYAVVPITENNVIYLFTGIEKVRRENTNNPEGKAYAVNNLSVGYNKENVIKI